MEHKLSSVLQARLNDIIELASHNGRDQWHGLRCHHINRGQFTATYADLAQRWGISRAMVYSTIKRFVKLGIITTTKFERATLFTVVSFSKSTTRQCAALHRSDSYEMSSAHNQSHSVPLYKNKKDHTRFRRKYQIVYVKRRRSRYSS